MKYEIGDIVLITHSGEEGQVVDIINDKMLIVDVKGVTFPVYAYQVEYPYFKRFTEKKIQPAKKEKKYIDDVRKEKRIEVNREEDGVWLTFLPVMDFDEFGDVVVEELKLHLVNHTRLVYNFTYKLHFFGKPDFELKNTVQPFEDFYLHDIPFEDLNDSPTFDFEFTLPVPEKGKASHYEAGVKLKPKQLFAKIEELNYPDKLVEDKVEMGKLAAKGYKVYDASKGRQHLEPARSVIDLHIEKLADDYRRMSNFDIVSLQLKTFEKYYDLAVAHRQPHLIVVHGVGEGVLRDEIHDILRMKKEVKSFVNQYTPGYGYGATEIYFQI
ncbi:MAG: Smr/MutS family protein [Chitinophagaceae bacterium]|nr:Smr/MutS family protein [Chitinophagaceae bacterium]